MHEDPMSMTTFIPVPHILAPPPYLPIFLSYPYSHTPFHASHTSFSTMPSYAFIAVKFLLPLKHHFPLLPPKLERLKRRIMYDHESGIERGWEIDHSGFQRDYCGSFSASSYERFKFRIFWCKKAWKRSHGKLNTIVMNAVTEARVHCGDVDVALKVFDEMTKPESCGVDNVTYGTLLKVLGKARRFDECLSCYRRLQFGQKSRLHYWACCENHYLLQRDHSRQWEFEVRPRLCFFHPKTNW